MPQNINFEMMDIVHHIFISNNEKFITLITVDKVVLVSTNPRQGPEKLELELPDIANLRVESENSSEDEQDEVMKDVLDDSKNMIRVEDQ